MFKCSWWHPRQANDAVASEPSIFSENHYYKSFSRVTVNMYVPIFWGLVHVVAENYEQTHTHTHSANLRRNLTEMLHVLGEQTGTKLSCIKPTSKVRELSIEPRFSTGCND